ncbi:cobalamin-binding protein [Candidatus Palauibacter sp.]|uniref:cobalamin-binding protein n=1 Tax=Candidatus Palauibacter sp. TaxID=3101350 RepID=UPI003B011EAD
MAADGGSTPVTGANRAGPRIVSLLASGTEIVDALGLGGCLVGISHECDHPPCLLDRPRVSRPRFDPRGLSSGEIDAAVRRAMADHGSVYEIDGQVLDELDPDIIITQAVCEVCAVPTGGVREVLGARGIEAEVVSLDAHTIGEILASLEQVARAAGQPEVSRGPAGSLRARLDAVREAVRGTGRPRVLGIEWLDPPFAPGHWVPEMIDLAGGRNLIGEAGRPSRETTWERGRGSRSGRAPHHALRLRARSRPRGRRRCTRSASCASRRAPSPRAGPGSSTPPPTSTARAPAS